MKIILVLSLLLLAGCAKYDKHQSFLLCNFEASKRNPNMDVWQKNDFIDSCMSIKGYVFHFDEMCGTVANPEYCWNYSWRVFAY